MTTTNMSLNEPSVGTTAGPTWATEVNENFTTIDQHDHTSGKGVQLTPSALNINSDLEFNGNAAIELKRLTFDSSATGSGTNYSVYQSGGNLYWYNGSGQAVQITNGANVKTTGGSIDGMGGTDAQVLYGSGIYRFEFDTTLSPFSGAKMAHGDILLYKYDGSSGSDAYVILKYTGSSAGSNNITVPDETGTMLTTSTSFGGNISIAATGGSNTITLDAEGDINLDSNSGVLTFKDNGTAIGKISNSSSDLVIENEVDAKDTIFKQYDGNEVVRMADDRRLYFFDKGGEYIVGDGTDLTVASGGAINLTATTDVVVPANVGITFGTGEKIEGDNTDLTLTSGADINLTATADVNLPNNVGLVFGDDGEKIEGDGTDLTIASSGEINLNSGTLDLSAQTVDVTLNGAVDALNFDSNTLSIDASNNRVGISTNAPESFFHTKGAGEVQALFENPSTSASQFAYVDIESNASSAGEAVLRFKTPDGTSYINSKGSATTMTFSSGKVGIGEQSPDHTLHVEKSISAGTAVSWIHNSNNVDGTDGLVVSTINNNSAVETFHVRSNNSTATNGNSLFLVRGDGNVGIGLTPSQGKLHISQTGTGNSNRAFFWSMTGGNGLGLYNDGSDNVLFGMESQQHLQFMTNAVARMTIDKVSGNVSFLGNTLVSGYNSFWDEGVYVGVNNGDNQLRVGQTGGGSAAIAIGNRTITVYNASDERKKNVIGETKRGLNDVLSWEIKDFTWKPEWDRDTETVQTGAIAQELYKTNPELINKNEIYYKESEQERGLIPEGKKVGDLKQDVWGIEWINTIPYLVKAIQELSAKVTALEGS